MPLDKRSSSITCLSPFPLQSVHKEIWRLLVVEGSFIWQIKGVMISHGWKLKLDQFRAEIRYVVLAARVINHWYNLPGAVTGQLSRKYLHNLLQPQAQCRNYDAKYLWPVLHRKSEQTVITVSSNFRSLWKLPVTCIRKMELAWSFSKSKYLEEINC